ncbi:hypothetical protein CGLO_00600 [Colletotrichum gloeosporioides Cg-14]|uniref:Uncharacterized protein n=1 Tax=Colletotrichum gloeosporioides (strain Cg-14) TaxID=1237896 RepID=T0L3N5_COLGC|nr:hypothetical protein CGLO_00600 [Colletotrichum gloeosporioides Cg-14]
MARASQLTNSIALRQVMFASGPANTIVHLPWSRPSSLPKTGGIKVSLTATHSQISTFPRKGNARALSTNISSSLQLPLNHFNITSIVILPTKPPNNASLTRFTNRVINVDSCLPKLYLQLVFSITSRLHP